MASKQPRSLDLGRFSDPAVVILTCLADGPKHGYAMIAESDAMGLPLGLGTLYGALNRLERMGLIEALPSEERRRPYRLTTRGAGVLREQLTLMREVVLVGLRKLGQST
jgi:DNA-binding PadR family transcriptional regulator